MTRRTLTALGEFIRKRLDDRTRPIDVLLVGVPCRVIHPLTRVIEAVLLRGSAGFWRGIKGWMAYLTSWSAVQVDPDAQSGGLSPLDGEFEVLQGSFMVWFVCMALDSLVCENQKLCAP